MNTDDLITTIKEAFGQYPEDVLGPAKMADEAFGWLHEVFVSIQREVEDENFAARIVKLASAGAYLADGIGSYCGAEHAYRRAVDEGGAFEVAFCRSLAVSLRAPVLVAGSVTRGLHAACCETAAHLAGRGPIGVPLSAIPELDDAGLDELRELIDDPDELDHELRRYAPRNLGSLRGPAAWAGWRVLARDRSVI